jgi:endonuclease/exonuclease/phosphatase family metal-dependent hydrolase
MNISGITVAALAIGIALSATALAQQQEEGASSAPKAQTEQKADKLKRPAGPRFGIPTPPKKAEGTLRLAAYNLLNLFDRVDDPALSGEWDDMKLAVTDDRAKALAEAIRRLDADILVLEEIESKEALKWFRDTYLAGMGYDHMESLDAGYYRGVEQSVLSRFPLKNPRVFLDAKLEVEKDGEDAPAKGSDAAAKSESQAPRDDSKFQRSPLAVEVDLPGEYELLLYAIHHKAGGKDFEAHREAEARKILELVKADTKGKKARNVALLGDFNATPNSSVRALYKDAKFVNGYDFRDPADVARQKTKLSDEERAALNEKYTTHESERPIDYILLSPGFAKDAVPGSFFVLSTLYPGDAYNWKTDPHPAGYASDHRPIAIDFKPVDEKTK